MFNTCLYIYLSPFTSYKFRCLLHHLQGDHCVTCSRTVCFLQLARSRWEVDIKMDLQDVRRWDMDWIDLAQDSDRWRALANALMNIRAQ